MPADDERNEILRDDSYLRHPLKRYGMDHSWYPWRPLNCLPPEHWVGAPVGVMIVLHAERFEETGPGWPVAGRGGGNLAFFDYREASLREYGLRMGAPRVQNLLRELGLSYSLSINARAAQVAGDLVRGAVNDGAEIIAKGWQANMVHAHGVSVHDEADAIQRTLATVTDTAGVPVTSWMSPSLSITDSTHELVRERGIERVLDTNNDIVPFRISTRSGSLCSIPYAWEFEDLRVIWELRQDSTTFAEDCLVGLNYELDEARDGVSRIFSIGIHGWIGGQPHRFAAIRNMLQTIAAVPGVRFVCPSEIESHWNDSSLSDEGPVQ
jgi:allantoinase